VRDELVFELSAACRLAEIRRTIAEWLAEHGHTAAADDIVSVANELATNVVLHGVNGTGSLRVSMDVDTVTITSENRSAALSAGPRTVPADDESGRGLVVVGRTARQVTIDRDGDRVVVSAHVDLAGRSLRH
jgi:anti-sigma regulatory factor (Ser/Thr protein kinase)